jgi:hypothetical protein
MCSGDSLDFIGVLQSSKRRKIFIGFSSLSVYISFGVGFPVFKPKGDDMKCLSLSLIICSTDGERLDNFFEKEPHHLKRLLATTTVKIALLIMTKSCWNLLVIVMPMQVQA